jgi:hypothetical protein
MTKHWTEAARAAAAERARRNQPWTRSTGPKTDIGKLVSRMNALKHGLRSRIREQPYRIIRERLRAIQRYIRAVSLYVDFKARIARKKISDQRTELMLEALERNIAYHTPPPDPPVIDWAEYDAILNEKTPYLILNQM